MAKALPKKWCASFYANSITLKKMTAINVRHPRGSLHDTWVEAHAALIERRENECKKAEKELKSRRAALGKAKLMQPPQSIARAALKEDSE